jgi:hypothetical protein
MRENLAERLANRSRSPNGSASHGLSHLHCFRVHSFALPPYFRLFPTYKHAHLHAQLVYCSVVCMSYPN